MILSINNEIMRYAHYLITDVNGEAVRKMRDMPLKQIDPTSGFISFGRHQLDIFLLVALDVTTDELVRVRIREYFRKKGGTGK